jgi:hypothetical protein
MVVAISATIVYYVRDYQVWVLISWIIIGIGWLIEHGKTPERQEGNAENILSKTFT